MSKIADYFEQQERARARRQEEAEKQTVADFAEELKKSPDSLLKQLHEAGIQKNSETDRLTASDKAALLSFLQKKYSPDEPRKKIKLKKIATVYESESDKHLKAVAEQTNGAEWEFLEYFCGDVIAGNRIDPVLQAVANLVFAKAFIFQALPLKKLGRPKRQETEDLGRELAQKYWDLRDSGTSYSEAVRHLAEKVHKDERHIMRLVEKHKKDVGLTFEEREKKRQWATLMRSMVAPLSRSPGALYSLFSSFNIPPPEFTGEDYVEYLDEQIVRTVKTVGSTGIKETLVIASD